MLATRENMKRHEAVSGLVAYSRFTGESYSADWRDYFWLSWGEVLLDESGGALRLGCKRSGRVVGLRSGR